MGLSEATSIRVVDDEGHPDQSRNTFLLAQSEDPERQLLQQTVRLHQSSHGDTSQHQIGDFSSPRSLVDPTPQSDLFWRPPNQSTDIHGNRSDTVIGHRQSGTAPFSATLRWALDPGLPPHQADRSSPHPHVDANNIPPSPRSNTTSASKPVPEFWKPTITQEEDAAASRRPWKGISSTAVKGTNSAAQTRNAAFPLKYYGSTRPSDADQSLVAEVEQTNDTVQHIAQPLTAAQGEMAHGVTKPTSTAAVASDRSIARSPPQLINPVFWIPSATSPVSHNHPPSMLNRVHILKRTNPSQLPTTQPHQSQGEPRDFFDKEMALQEDVKRREDQRVREEIKRREYQLRMGDREIKRREDEKRAREEEIKRREEESRVREIESTLTEQKKMDVSSPIVDLTGKIMREGNYPVAHGGFGDVWKGIWHHPSGNRKVAVKVVRPRIDDPEVEKKMKKRVHRELRVWQRLDHENVLPLYGTVSDFGHYTAMCCPWMQHGSITKYIERHRETLTLADRLRLLGEVAAGLYYLHSYSVIHGDLTGANILVNDDGKACLCDFGMSSIIAEFQGTSYLTSSLGGAVRWSAPELYRIDDDESAPSVSTHSDIYSYGCVMLEVLSDRVPFYHLRKDVQVVLELIKGNKPHRPPDSCITDSHWGLIQRCWAEVPEDRPDVLEVVRCVQRLGREI